MSIQTCKEILLHIKKLYQEARSSKKRKILDELIETTKLSQKTFNSFT